MSRLYINIAIIAFFFTLFLACDANPYKQGKMYYTQYCGNCHMENGEGLRGLIPPLVNVDYLKKERNMLPCIIQKGIKGVVTVNGIQYGEQEMPAIPKLTDFEVTNILNYIGNAWGNKEKLWTVEKVRESLKACN